jgi:hypothetical protein
LSYFLYPNSSIFATVCQGLSLNFTKKGGNVLENYSEFGLNARAAMLKMGITLTALAKELGISTYYLSEILKGTRPGNKYKGVIARTLGIREEVCNEPTH